MDLFLSAIVRSERVKATLEVAINIFYKDYIQNFNLSVFLVLTRSLRVQTFIKIVEHLLFEIAIKRKRFFFKSKTCSIYQNRRVSLTLLRRY